MLSLRLLDSQYFRLIGQHTTNFVVVILKGHLFPDGFVDVPLVFMGEEAGLVSQWQALCFG